MAYTSTINANYVTDLYQGISQGDRLSLAKGITLIESHKSTHQEYANQLLTLCLKQNSSTLRIGITGTPGVGKSTFIESLGKVFIEAGHRLSVLTIDPTSPVNHGSILGDKSRMDFLSNHSQAFVRSSPSRALLGGTTDKTRETISLCESGGYDVTFIETVGIGQSETEILKMVDFLILLVLPGSGDEIQGIKRGIVEVADLVVVNKADRNNDSMVKDTVNVYKFALHLKVLKESSWASKALSCSALKGNGISEIYQAIQEYHTLVQENGYLTENRRHQGKEWLKDAIVSQAAAHIKTKISTLDSLGEIENKVQSSMVTAQEGAAILLSQIFDDRS